MSPGPLLRVAALARVFWRRFAASVFLGALAIGASVALMGTSGYLISRSARRPPILSLEVAIAAVQCFGISRALARYGERLVSHDATLRLLGRLRLSFYERLEPLVPAGLPGGRSGDLLSGFVADIDMLQNVFLRGVGPPLVALVVGLGAVLAAAALLPVAAPALALGLLLATVALPAAVAALARASGRAQATARGDLASEVVELLAAAPELAVFGRTDAQLERVAVADARLRAIVTRHALAGGLGEGGVTLLAGGTALAVLALGLRGVASGALAGVLLAALVLLSLAAFEAARPLAEATRQLTIARGAAARLFALTDREPPVADPAAPLPAPAGTLLRFEDVRLRYDPAGPWVLDGVSLALRQGARVALVGRSGAGKSTLASLAVRFRDPDGGRVVLDGEDVRRYAQDDLRAAVALGAQDAHLFTSTIRENLRLARPQADDVELERALWRAQAGDWVRSLADGLDTAVGEGGAAVSGGQRQRIALARVLLSGAPLLILDEPTAHLDPKTAEAVLNALFEARPDAGILVITHAQDGLDRFDEVWLLQQGRLVTV